MEQKASSLKKKKKQKQDWQAPCKSDYNKEEKKKKRNNKGEITNTKVIQGLIRGYFEDLYLNKLENCEEMENISILMTIQNWTRGY
jgi:hypothetical protein